MLKKALLAALLIASVAPCANAAIPWIKNDYDAAVREAKVRKQPLLIYFHTTWCSWCAQMEDKVFSDDEVTYQANAFVAVRLNCDRRQGQKEVAKYKVTSFPTVVVATTEGEVLGRLAMYRSAPEFIEFMQDSLKPSEQLAAIDKRIADGDRAPEPLMKSAARHFEAGDLDLAAQRYEQALAVMPAGSDDQAAEARVGIGTIKSTQGDSAAALENFLEVLKKYPGSKHLSEAFAGALLILREQNKGEEIDALFQQFQGRFPDDPAVLNDYAKRLLETGKDPALALANAKRAAQLAPEAADCYATLAKAWLANGKPVEALDAISSAIERAPTDKDIRIMRLDILEAARKLPEELPSAAGRPAGSAPAPASPAEKPPAAPAAAASPSPATVKP